MFQKTSCIMILIIIAGCGVSKEKVFSLTTTVTPAEDLWVRSCVDEALHISKHKTYETRKLLESMREMSIQNAMRNYRVWKTYAIEIAKAVYQKDSSLRSEMEYKADRILQYFTSYCPEHAEDLIPRLEEIISSMNPAKSISPANKNGTKKTDR